ncbi:hypothetical protein PUNSTDRAFT_54748, partial [Punctularia strigosozonata HHB-11173 SS5]|uniref:uncharacterized protein n=1 Tax=Punctularia strigosozonata (strain HHB-11173) TaxID=741275 RepID=UPI0004416CE6
MIELTGLRCTGLGKHRHYCTIQAGRESLRTPISPKTNQPIWDDAFSFSGEDLSPVVIKIWVRHTNLPGL